MHGSRPDPLVDAWDGCCRGEGLDASRLRPAWRDLFARWEEPHRRYHAPSHLVACLAAWSAHRAEFAEPWLAGFALAYHDAVYDPLRGDNEARSAALAERDLAAGGLSAGRARMVADLVRATAHTGPAAAGDAALLLDIDLVVLGGAGDDYDRYVAAVRAEYARIDEATWRSGRAAVLRTFLARDRIFASAAFAGLEGSARANLRRELDALEG